MLNVYCYLCTNKNTKLFLKFLFEKQRKIFCQLTISVLSYRTEC